MDGKEAIGELFSKSVFGTNRTVTIGAGDVRKFLVLKPQMRELRRAIDVELARVLVARRRKQETSSAAQRQGGHSDGPSTGTKGEINIEKGREVSDEVNSSKRGPCASSCGAW